LYPDQRADVLRPTSEPGPDDPGAVMDPAVGLLGEPLGRPLVSLGEAREELELPGWRIVLAEVRDQSGRAAFFDPLEGSFGVGRADVFERMAAAPI
jgi:hypothetical protein